MKPRGGEGQNGRLKCPMGFLVYLSLVRVPKSRVTQGSGFLGSGETYSGRRCRGGVWFSETSDFLVSGLVPW